MEEKYRDQYEVDLEEAFHRNIIVPLLSISE
jgi:hypothetical protein